MVRTSASKILGRKINPLFLLLYWERWHHFSKAKRSIKWLNYGLRFRLQESVVGNGFSKSFGAYRTWKPFKSSKLSTSGRYHWSSSKRMANSISCSKGANQIVDHLVSLSMKDHSGFKVALSPPLSCFAIYLKEMNALH